MPALNKLEIISRLTRMATDRVDMIAEVYKDRKLDVRQRNDKITELQLDQAALKRCVAMVEATMAPVIENAPCSDLCAKDKHLDGLRDQSEERSK